MELNEILNLQIEGNERTPTIRHFLYDLLAMVIVDQESFDGKRPWGNSGWMHDLYKPLIKNNLIDGNIDEDGYIDSVNHVDAEMFIVNKILKPFFGVK